MEGYLNSEVFVGRERERERIREALRETCEGHGQVVMVESEPGVGRSRFLAEVATMARVSGMRTVSVDAGMRERPCEAVIAASLLALASAPHTCVQRSRCMRPR